MLYVYPCLSPSLTFLSLSFCLLAALYHSKFKPLSVYHVCFFLPPFHYSSRPVVGMSLLSIYLHLLWQCSRKMRDVSRMIYLDLLVSLDALHTTAEDHSGHMLMLLCGHRPLHCTHMQIPWYAPTRHPGFISTRNNTLCYTVHLVDPHFIL